MCQYVLTKPIKIIIITIQLNLCGIFNNGHCHKELYSNAEIQGIYNKLFSYAQAKGDNNKEKSLKRYEEETLRETRLKINPILIFVTPESTIINYLSSITVY